MRGETPDSILEFLKKGDQDMRFGASRNAVLVLGLTGTGKSTLTRFIAGDNGNLISEEKGKGNYVVREHSGKICKSTVKSCTAIPELVIDRSANNTAYYDSPGFSDNRSLAHNIGTSYFIRKIISRIDSVKIVLAIDYDSVRPGGDRLSFLGLVEHLYSMIKDVGKFERSIILVVTKVENLFTKIGRQYTIVPDEEMIINVVEFFQEVEDYINSQLDNNLSLTEQQFYRNTAKIVDILINRKKPKHPRVGIFRRPDELGPLSKMELLQKGRASIREIIYDQLVYTPCSQNDFGHTISESSEFGLLRLKEEIERYISHDIYLIGEQLISYYGEQERRSNDMDALHASLKKAHCALSKIKDGGSARAFVEDVIRNLNALDVSISWGKVRYILNYCGYLEFIQPMLRRSTDERVQWRDGMKNVLNYLDESNKWFHLFIDLRTTLSEYKLQRDIGRYASIVQDLQSDTDVLNPGEVLKSLKTFLREIEEHSGREYEIPSETLSVDKGRFLKALTETAFQNVTTDCRIHSTENDKTDYKLVIKGYNVKMSEVSTLKCPDDKPFNVVEILALNKVFFDADYLKRGGVVSVIAPDLDVVGQQILVLDGDDGFTHSPGKAVTINRQPGSKGENGKPGLPGGSAGELVLIGLSCTNCNMLSVSTVGGKGGRGQDGGDGVRGADGDKPVNTSSETRFDSDLNAFKRVHKNAECVVRYVTQPQCNVTGSRGQQGGAGGDGGKGGLGGNEGKVLIIFPKNYVTHLPEVTTGQRSRGAGGLGGPGGQGGVQYQLTFHLSYNTVYVSPGGSYLSTSVTTASKSYYKVLDKALDGIKGDDDVNGTSHPKSLTNNSTAYSLNEYKNHIRQSFRNPVNHPALRNFLQYLEVHEGFNQFYDTKALVNDMMIMEHHFHDILDEDTVLSYKRLLERILKYAQNPQSKEKSDEYKMVWAYLYATTLSKICRLRENLKGQLVIDMKGYLRGVKQHIEQLQEFDKTVEKNNVKSKYNEVIVDKINEANNLIKREITPAIDSYNRHLEDSMGVLFNETIALETQAEAERSKLIDQKAKLANQLVLATMLGVVQVASQALALLGPVGAGVGAGIGITSSVAQSLLLSDVSEDYSVSNLPAAVDKRLTLFKTQFEHKKKNLEQKLADADKILSDFKDDPQSTTEIKQILGNTREEMNINFDKAVTGNAQSLQKMFSLPRELEESLATRKAFLDKQTDKSQKTTKIIEAITKIQDVMSIPAEIVDVYKKVSKGKSSMDTLNTAIKQSHDKITKFKEYEKKIYSAIFPACQLIREVFKNTEKSSAGKSHTALDVSKWKVQTTLKEIQTQLKEMTDGFKTQSQVMSCVDKVMFGMTTMIQVYDRIQDYYDEAQLADYIAEITSNKAKIKVRDRELQEDIDELEFKMHTNIVLAEFQKSMSAVRQSVFPYARKYMENLHLPNQMKVGNYSHSISEIIRSATGVLEHLEKDSTIIQDSDEHSFSAQNFNSQDSSKPPFYVWKHYRNEELIKDLMRGKAVMLNADIASGLKENAIKFDRIGVNFKMHCKKLQKDLRQVLTGFSVELTHMGNSYYRCGNKVFLMTHSSLVIKHSVIKRNRKKDRKRNDEYYNENDVYKKIKNNDALVSPYTMWRLKLGGGDFSELSDYVGEKIDIELEGRGNYLERTIDDAICTDDLKQYYVEESSRISEKELIGVEAGPDDEDAGGCSIGDSTPSTLDRVRRSDDEDEDGFSTVDSAPSTLARLIRSTQQGIRYLNPFGLAKWLTTEQPLPDNSSLPTAAYPSLIPPQNTTFNISSSNQPLALARHENDTAIQKVDYSLVDVHGNLLWMDMLIRKARKNGHQQTKMNRKYPEDDEIAQNLAYNAHVP